MTARHGSPRDRGSADAYYGGSPTPHFYCSATGKSRRVTEAEMTTEQIAEYMQGYDGCSDRKDW